MSQSFATWRGLFLPAPQHWEGTPSEEDGCREWGVREEDGGQEETINVARDSGGGQEETINVTKEFSAWDRNSDLVSGFWHAGGIEEQIELVGASL